MPSLAGLSPVTLDASAGPKEGRVRNRGLTLLLLASLTGATSPAHAVCPSFAGPFEVARVETDELDEASGLVASRRHPGIFWTHNDSGDGPRVFAIDRQGRLRGLFELADTEAIDWEDLAIGPGPEPGRNYLYLADVGDNPLERARVLVHRIAEPELPPAATADKTQIIETIDTFILEQPRGPQDTEAIVVDPVSGDLLLLTKEDWGCEPVPGPNCGRGWILRAPSLAREPTGRVVELEVEGRFEVAPEASRYGRLTSAADSSEDGHWILIRTYLRAGLWERRGDESLSETLARRPCSVPVAGWPEEKQGEAIAFAPNGQRYWTISEGEHPMLFEYVRTPLAVPSASTR